MNPIQFFKTSHVLSKVFALSLLAANIAVNGWLWGVISFTAAFIIGWYGTWGILVLIERRSK